MARGTSCSRHGPMPSCSDSGGSRSRTARSCCRARSMPGSGAATGSPPPAGPPGRMAFSGRPLGGPRPARLVWTNEEGDGGTVVTTATFEDDQGRTRLVVHDRYPSKEALDEAVASGATSWNSETFDQLDELLVKLRTSTRR